MACDVGKDLDLNAHFSDCYPILRKMARSRLRLHQPFTLLDTTELIHESYLKALSVESLAIEEKGIFLNYVGQVMRSIIVDAARKKLAKKNSSGADTIDIADVEDLITDIPANEIIQVHDALTALSDTEPRLAKVIELIYFSGMSEIEIGECLNISDRTVRRESSKACLMLRAMLAL